MIHLQSTQASPSRLSSKQEGCNVIYAQLNITFCNLTLWRRQSSTISLFLSFLFMFLTFLFYHPPYPRIVVLHYILSNLLNLLHINRGNSRNVRNTIKIQKISSREQGGVGVGGGGWGWKGVGSGCSNLLTSLAMSLITYICWFHIDYLLLSPHRIQIYVTCPHSPLHLLKYL